MDSELLLRLHYFLPLSYANGPGARAVIWVQGCTLGCPGCFNAPTHPTKGGEVIGVETLFQRIAALQDTIEGITISGGEPLQQQAGMARLIERVKAETSLSVVLFSGFSWEELGRMGQSQQVYSPDYPLPLLKNVDVLIAGRYVQQFHLARDLRGSSNKTLHFLTERYTASDMQAVPLGEIVLTTEGEIIMSGIEPLIWQEK